MHSEQIPAAHPAAQSRLVHRLLVRLVSFVCRFPRSVLAVTFLLAAVSTFVFYTRLEYHTQRSDLINPHKEHQRRWRQHLAEFGDDDDMVVVVRGSDSQRIKHALETLAERIRQQPERFDRLFYVVDLRHLKDRGLLLAPEEQIKQIQRNIKRITLLDPPIPATLVDPWKNLTLQWLFFEANRRVSKPHAPIQGLSEDDAQFFAQLLAITRSATTTLDNPAAYSSPWLRLEDRPQEQQNLLADPQYFFSGDQVLACLLVRPVKVPGSFTAAWPSVASLRAVVDAVGPEYADLEFGLTGLPVLETDEMVAAEHDTQLAMWLAVAGVTVLFIVVYRGICYPLLTVATLLVGTAWAMGWMTLTVGHVNILSATFAVMLVGMGDYGVLWVMRYDQARRQGADVRSALLHTTTHVAIGNLTAAMTLALAFYAAMLSDFQAVKELGWIAGSGVLLCALACFTVLPALLMIFDRRSLVEAHSAERHGATVTVLSLSAFRAARSPAEWLPRLFRRPRWIVAGGFALTAMLGICAFHISYDHNLLHLQPRNLDSVKWEQVLFDHTAGASWYAVSSAATSEEALALKAKYEKRPDVGRVVEVASLVPPHQERKLEMIADIHRRLQNLPARGKPIPHDRPRTDNIQVQLASLTKRLAPLTAGGGQPLLADVYRCGVELQGKLKRTGDRKRQEERLQVFEQRLTGDLAENLHQLRDVSTPKPITVADLPPDLRARYVGQTGKWLLQIFPASKENLWEIGPLEQFTKRIREVDPNVTGKPFTTVEGLKGMKNGLEKAGLYAFVAIVLVLLVDFRNLRLTLLALAPLVMGLLLSLGIMGLFGVPLNPANMIAFPLILGVGVDNGVHVLHDYLLRRNGGQGTISHAIGRGVLVKALTTIIGFGTLMISSQRGLVGLGFILTLGVTCCMLTALVFLPAVLRMWGGLAVTNSVIEVQLPATRRAA